MVEAGAGRYRLAVAQRLALVGSRLEVQAAHMDLEQQVIHLARDLRMLTMALICLSRLLEVTKVAPADAGASVYDAVIKELSMEDRRRMSVVLPLLAGWAQSPSPE